MNIYYQNFLYIQDFQKQAHDNGMKPYSYAPGKKFCLNSKYIKTKQNQKLKVKFFGPFWVLHLVGKQIYKFELYKKWKIHDIFYISLLE